MLADSLSVVECGLCFGDMIKVKALGCGHMFCGQCAKVLVSGKCPYTCEGYIKLTDVRRLYQVDEIILLVRTMQAELASCEEEVAVLSDRVSKLLIQLDDMDRATSNSLEADRLLPLAKRIEKVFDLIKSLFFS